MERVGGEGLGDWKLIRLANHRGCAAKHQRAALVLVGLLPAAPLTGPAVGSVRGWPEQAGTMPESDRELLRLGALARRQPLQRRIMRSVASSTAIETRQPISSIEANLLASKQVVVNRRLVTLA